MWDLIALEALKAGSFSFECFINFANLFYKLSESTFYKKMSFSKYYTV